MYLISRMSGLSWGLPEDDADGAAWFNAVNPTSAVERNLSFFRFFLERVEGVF